MLNHADGSEMFYSNIKKGIFKSRPNRFIAHVEIDGVMEVCHVKNTGRCKELLVEDAIVYLEENNNPSRKTKYSLIGVVKGERLINMDSQAPNKVVYEWIKDGNLFQDIIHLKTEKTFGNSRFDLYVETKTEKAFIEVKGVTLEEDGIVRFPDAPTIRGIKHIHELIECKQEGYEAYLILVIQMKNVKWFEPNNKTQPQFQEALIKAKNSGVNIIAMDCEVFENRLIIRDEVEVVLKE